MKKLIIKMAMDLTSGFREKTSNKIKEKLKLKLKDVFYRISVVLIPLCIALVGVIIVRVLYNKEKSNKSIFIKPRITFDTLDADFDETEESSMDDLTAIKGIGNKIQEKLYEMDIMTYEQLVASEHDLLEAFGGRVMRDDWIVQAKTLLEGY